MGTVTLYIEPGSPWEERYFESFNGKLRDACLNGEIFYSLREMQIVIEKWRMESPQAASPAARSPWEANPSLQPMAVIYNSSLLD